MKRIIIWLGAVIVVSSSCSVKEKTFTNFADSSIILMAKEDLYFMRICSKDTLVREYQPSIRDTVESELPLVSYVNCATYQDEAMLGPDSLDLTRAAHEELYLYLHGFSGQLESGEASFLITEKFKRQNARSRYYADPCRLYLDKIKKIRIGSWSKIINGQYHPGTIQLKFTDGKKNYILLVRVNGNGESINILKMTNPSFDMLSRSKKSANAITINQVLGFKEEGFPMFQALYNRDAVIRSKSDGYIAVDRMYLDLEEEKLYFSTGDLKGYRYKGKVEAIDFLKDFEKQLIENY